jgi:flagellar protein FlbB
MNTLSPRIKIAYLTLLILFSIAVFLYLLDTWNIINARKYIPFLSDQPPVVSETADSIALLEEERRRKEEERLAELELKLKEMEARLSEEKAALEEKKKEYEELKQGLQEEKKRLEEKRRAEANKEKMIAEMAQRLNNMPPNDAVAILAGWSDADIVDVFLRMERNAEAEGTTSIVPFLLTKMPRERAAIITSQMLDEEARLKPVIE